MNPILHFIICFLITSVMGALSLFLCYLTDYKEEIWQDIQPDE
jgi:hypothetical protein